MGSECGGHRGTVDAIIEQDGEIDLIERSYKPYEGDMDLSGGSLCEAWASGSPHSAFQLVVLFSDS